MIQGDILPWDDREAASMIIKWRLKNNSIKMSIPRSGSNIRIDRATYSRLETPKEQETFLERAIRILERDRIASERNSYPWLCIDNTADEEFYRAEFSQKRNNSYIRENRIRWLAEIEKLHAIVEGLISIRFFLKPDHESVEHFISRFFERSNGEVIYSDYSDNEYYENSRIICTGTNSQIVWLILILAELMLIYGIDCSDDRKSNLYQYVGKHFWKDNESKEYKKDSLRKLFKYECTRDKPLREIISILEKTLHIDVEPIVESELASRMNRLH
jgi:hypothetical protein